MELKTAGRPGIDQQTYINQIQSWLKDCRLDEITATQLQKAVGGQYKKAATILEEFKAGYETKELSELPEPPEQLGNALNAAALEIWRMLWEAKTKEVAEMQAVFDHEKAKLIALADERLECIDALEADQDALREQIRQLHRDAADHRQQFAETREQLVTETARCEGLSDQVQDKAQQLLESKQATELANDKWQTSQRQHDEAMISIKQDHAANVTSLQSTIEQLSDEHKIATQQLTAQRASTEKAESQVKEITAKLADMKALHSHESEKADQQIAALQTRLDTQSDKITSVTAELAAANQRAQSSDEQLVKAEQRAEEVLSRFMDTAGTWQQKLAATMDDELDQVTIFDQAGDDASFQLGGDIKRRIADAFDERSLNAHLLAEFFEKFTAVVAEKIDEGFAGDVALYQRQFLEAILAQETSCFFNMRKLRETARKVM